MLFQQIEDEGLAQRAYLIGCQRSGHALLIDPQRDVDRYKSIARRAGTRITAVAETHIHADFLAGTKELVASHGCHAYLSAEGGREWQYEWAQGQEGVTLLRDGDRFAVGSVGVQAKHTPGHTPEHMCFLITDLDSGMSEAEAVVSGDFIFVGDLGRPDLLELAVGQEGRMEPSARQLYSSAQHLLELPDDLRIWPGHGAGSMCGKSLGSAPSTTVGQEKGSNPALAAARRGEDPFVSYILGGQPEPPLYFRRMKLENQRGPKLLGPLPQPTRLTSEELLRVSKDGHTSIVDTRSDRGAYYAAHLAGSIYAPVNALFCTVAGCYLDPSAPVVLVCRKDHVEEAVRRLVRVGLDRVVGWAPPGALDAIPALGGRLAHIPELRFQDLGRRRALGEDYRLLDVRRASEYVAGHVEDALNIAHTQLPDRLSDLPRDREVVVHCLSGARAAAAASLLARERFQVSAVNDVLVNAFR